MSIPRPKPEGLTTGQWLERRKSEARCLACGCHLSYRFDADAKTGFLFDFCVVCRPMKQPPPRKKFDTKREHKRGIENLDRILGKL